MKWVIMLGLVLFSKSFAEEGQIKIQEPTSSGDKTITIKKGARGEDPDFEIITGNAEINGDPAGTSKEARASWKAACKEWKSELKELNKENMLLVADCQTPTPDKEGTQYVFHSQATYKMRVRIREKSH